MSAVMVTYGASKPKVLQYLVLFGIFSFFRTILVFSELLSEPGFAALLCKELLWHTHLL